MTGNSDITGINDISGEERRGRGQAEDGLEHAERDQFTEDPPEETQEQVGFLLGILKGGTKALAARLGVSQRTVQRYRKGTVQRPRTATREPAPAAGTSDDRR